MKSTYFLLFDIGITLGLNPPFLLSMISVGNRDPIPIRTNPKHLKMRCYPSAVKRIYPEFESSQIEYYGLDDKLFAVNQKRR